VAACATGSLQIRHGRVYKPHALFEAACAHELEGVVAKRRNSAYRPGERGWVKTKKRSYGRWAMDQESATKKRRTRSFVERPFILGGLFARPHVAQAFRSRFIRFVREAVLLTAFGAQSASPVAMQPLCLVRTARSTLPLRLDAPPLVAWN
jgi:hypothetical protein